MPNGLVGLVADPGDMGDVGELVRDVTACRTLARVLCPSEVVLPSPVRRRGRGDLYILLDGSVLDRLGRAVIGVRGTAWPLVGTMALGLLVPLWATASAPAPDRFRPGEDGRGMGHAYIEIGIAWCRPCSRGRFSRSRVSSGENT